MADQTITLTLTPEELNYLGDAVGQFDIEYVTAPDSVNEKIHQAADQVGIPDRLGWADRPKETT